MLTHLRQELGEALRIVFIKGAKHPGYLLLRSGCDLQHALYCALHDKRANDQVPAVGHKTTAPPTHRSSDELETVVLGNLNNTLHTQAKQWAELGRDPSKFAEVDIKQAIEDINPQLWRMICTLTEPKQSTDVLQAGHEADHCLAKSRQLPC